MKHGLKILVSVLLLLSLAVIANAAGTSEQGASSKELAVAAFQGAYGRDYWDAVAAEFMKTHPGTKVTVQADPQVGNQIRPQVVAGNPPDVVYLGGLGEHSGVTSGLIKEKGLLDLTDLFNGKAPEGKGLLKDQILPGVLDTLTCSPYGDGKVYLAPYSYSVMGLWYNKDFFDRNKITPPRTWDEFFALNDEAKKHDRALFTYQGIYPGYVEEMIIPALYEAGGKDAVKKFTTYQAGLWTSDAALKVLGIFERIATTDNMLMKGTVALNHTQSQTAFMQGKAMFIVNGSWFEAEMKDAPREDGFQFGFLGVPAFKAGDPRTCLVSIEPIYIPAKAKNPQLAREFLRFLYTKKSIELNAEKAKNVFAVKGAVDIAKPYITVSTYNCFKAVDEGMIPIEASLAPMAKGSKINIGDEIYNPISSVMNKELTAKQYADKLDALYASVRAELAAAGQ
jgi:N-acetylglucosamine transport system substrate-binding protein